LAIRTSEEDNLCNEVSQDGDTMCHGSSTLYIVSHITVLETYVTIFATTGNKN